MTALYVPPSATGAAEFESGRRGDRFSATLNGESATCSRPLLLLERTMYRDGSTPFTSVFTVQLRGEISEPRLRQALAQVQTKHPLLRCVVEEAAGGPRFVLHSRPAPIPLRMVERTTDLDWEREARREWVTPFGSVRDPFSQNPLVRMVWLRGAGVHELMLIGHHSVCDGPSGITLLRDCFAAYDDPQPQQESYQSLGAIEDLVPEDLLRDPRFRLRVRRRSALLRLALWLKRPRRSAASCKLSAEQMYFDRWQLGSTEAAGLVERCRKEDVTVLAAAAVAFVQAFREIRGRSALKHAYSMVNARRFMPRLHPEALFGIAPGVEIPIQTLPSSEKMPASSAFWESARAVRQNLTARVNRLGKRFYEYLAALETLHDRYPRLVADTEAAPVVQHVTFSSLGRLDLPQQYRSFQVERVYSPLVMVSPTPANTVVLSSFSGVMEFAIISDEVSLPRAQARAIGKRATIILRDATGIARPLASTVDRDHCAEGATV